LTVKRQTSLKVRHSEFRRGQDAWGNVLTKANNLNNKRFDPFATPSGRRDTLAPQVNNACLLMGDPEHWPRTPKKRFIWTQKDPRPDARRLRRLRLYLSDPAPRPRTTAASW